MSGSTDERSATIAAMMIVAIAAALPACGKSRASTGDGAADAGAPFVAPADPVRDALWARARADGGDADDLARLADREGASGLAARANADPSFRLTAARAMAYAPDPTCFEGLPFLAEVARGTSEVDADAALDSAVDMAARPRRGTDPEDAAELKQGCDALLALAIDREKKGFSRGRRVKAIRALRMLADRGCVDPATIPSDIDAH